MNTFVKAEIWTIARTEQGNAVLIRPLGAEVAVPIFIGQLEVQSILIGLGKVDMPRPLTHDLMITLLGRIGAEVERIEISDLRDNTFYAHLIVKTTTEEIVLDTRPSDAIAIAVRTPAPVYIAESIVEAAGIPVSLVMEATMEGTSLDNSGSAEEDLRCRLEKELAEAVEHEDYEAAARLRDRLKDL